MSDSTGKHSQKNTLLLCTDLDRTLLPNGHQPEPPLAREKFRRLAAHDLIQVVYVSGRSRSLILDAIRDYDLPVPDYAIADVGTNIYYIQSGHWELDSGWHQQIAKDWHGMTSWQIRDQLADFRELELQPEHKQDRFKLSYQISPSSALGTGVAAMQKHIQRLDVVCNVISSIDETSDIGLVDVLPLSANKGRAIEYLAKAQHIPLAQVVFSGDSGNDLDVLLSPVPSTLVGNATSEVKHQARSALRDHHGESVYFADNYYAAGIVEGFLHYFPAYHSWLDEDTL